MLSMFSMSGGGGVFQLMLRQLDAGIVKMGTRDQSFRDVLRNDDDGHDAGSVVPGDGIGVL